MLRWVEGRSCCNEASEVCQDDAAEAQVGAKRCIGHDWRQPPPASKACLISGQVLQVPVAACGVQPPCLLFPPESSFSGPGAQVVQESSRLCSDRCQFSRGQVRSEEIAAVDPRLFGPGLVASGCQCRCLPCQGQVRCPFDYVQATYAADAGPEVSSCFHHSFVQGTVCQAEVKVGPSLESPGQVGAQEPKVQVGQDDTAGSPDRY